MRVIVEVPELGGAVVNATTELAASVPAAQDGGAAPTGNAVAALAALASIDAISGGAAPDGGGNASQTAADDVRDGGAAPTNA